MTFKIMQIAIPFIWFGLIGGISFLEAPLKFRAPDITLALGLGIGRLVFFWLNKIELVLGGLMLISLLKVKPDKRIAIWVFSVIAGLLILETVWLLPVLDARATAVINGTAAPYSNTHVVYIVFDAVKFLLLFLLGVINAKSRLNIPQNEN
ncbi:MAG: hypothetical protein R2681_01520 [Pyrinomonadaceae bacterium]